MKYFVLLTLVLFLYTKESLCQESNILRIYSNSKYTVKNYSSCWSNKAFSKTTIFSFKINILDSIGNFLCYQEGYFIYSDNNPNNLSVHTKFNGINLDANLSFMALKREANKNFNELTASSINYQNPYIDFEIIKENGNLYQVYLGNMSDAWIEFSEDNMMFKKVVE
ncbi:MAG: hypothetical protein K1X55_01875 [Chitinophagales bacterium]|nr:hypothetical protein [Chitinophagales bacterium]